MTDNQNPFTNPQLLHPELADQIINVENWQAEHDASARVGVMGVAAAVRKTTQEQADSGLIEGVSPELSQALLSARNSLLSLVTDTRMEAPNDVPTFIGSEFENTDWARLDTGFQTYKQYGLRPEIVITPAGRDIEYWRMLYMRLCEWQAKNPPNNPHTRLLEPSEGGLSMHPDIQDHWYEFIPAEPGWRISVIAGVQNVLITNVNGEGKDSDGRMPQELGDILKATNTLDFHPSVEDYLTMMAIRFHQDEPPLDTETLTWLDHEFEVEGGVKAYPCGVLGEAFGENINARVALDRCKTAYIGNDIGARPIVRG